MMPTSTTADGDLLIKMDERQFRFQVQPGSNDRYPHPVGRWPTSKPSSRALEVLQAADVHYEMGRPELCQAPCAGVGHRDGSVRKPS